MDCATILPYGSNPANRYPTAYFRKTFKIVNPSVVTGLTVRARINDGMVLYLNGVEQKRIYMPDGAIAYSTLATVSVPPTFWTNILLSASGLVAGDNVLAVEAHQAATDSVDLIMDMTVTALVDEGAHVGQRGGFTQAVAKSPEAGERSFVQVACATVLAHVRHDGGEGACHLRLRQLVPELHLLEPGLWSALPEEVWALELRLSEKQGAEFRLRSPDEADARDRETLVPNIEVPVYLTGAWQDEQSGPRFTVMLDDFTGTDREKITLFNGRHPDGYTPLVLTRWYEFLEIYVDEQVPRIDDGVRALAPDLFTSFFGVEGLEFEPDRFPDFADDDLEGVLAAYEAEPKVRVLFENGFGDPDNPGTEAAPGAFQLTPRLLAGGMPTPLPPILGRERLKGITPRRLTAIKHNRESQSRAWPPRTAVLRTLDRLFPVMLRNIWRRGINPLSFGVRGSAPLAARSADAARPGWGAAPDPGIFRHQRPRHGARVRRA